MDYNYSGTNIELDKNNTIIYVIEKLSEYDKKIKNGIFVEESPYYSDILIPTENEKFVIVPKEIQNEAINKYNLLKSINEYEIKKNNIENEINKLYDKLENTNTDSNNNILFYITIILIILFAGFIIYKKLKNN